MQTRSVADGPSGRCGRARDRIHDGVGFCVGQGPLRISKRDGVRKAHRVWGDLVASVYVEELESGEEWARGRAELLLDRGRRRVGWDHEGYVARDRRESGRRLRTTL